MSRPIRKATLATIAAELGVSTASVSNALKRPERVSADLRSKVLAAATRVGYSGPAAATRLLPSGRANAIAILFTAELPAALRDPAAVAFLEGLSESCEATGTSLLLIPDMAAQPEARVAAVANAVVDGFVVYSLRDRDPLLPAVLRRGEPTVVIDAPRAVVGADWVGSDDRTAMRGLGEYLRGLGHRAVGIIGPQLNEMRHNGSAESTRWRGGGYALMRERIEGLQEGLGISGYRMNAMGVSTAGSNVAGSSVEELPIEERFDSSVASGADALHALLDRRPDLTAICCLTDVLAFGAMAGARHRGLTLPGDLTITGYDDVLGAASAGLTTVAQPHVDKGRAAGELLFTVDASVADRRRIFRTHLQIRASSGPPSR